MPVYNYSMPAIRYRYNNVCAAVVSFPHFNGARGVSQNIVEIRARNGGLVRVHWSGFVCMAGVPHLGPGGYGKIIAKQVSNGCGVSGDWRELSKDEFVLCWRVVRSDGKTTVYGIVDSDGWPLVMSDKRSGRLVVNG